MVSLESLALKHSIRHQICYHKSNSFRDMTKNQKCGNGGTNMAATINILNFCMAPYLKFVPIWWPNIVERFIVVLNFARLRLMIFNK